ncbi:TetR/AcrR family transcriptional regulator [Actinoplanes sp. TBRC 11911]|uniref:TetR/AcrR family transcriptional regulator n=1 Tax=Actinoplanes sp. TBRC 11911 TaxID=2729386 RepID=UPI00145E2CC0|nr:TetR/AcrR family transcriptional regulator [Actinoplanes sp. TBRC 11911]NMO52780.1 TetR/AcrR family transcriptional regulator [Actinoplanes sp. TBRC 11911]
MADDRRTQLLDLAYAYVREHGIAEVSLRPLAAAIGSSPRVLLFLFESKDGLIRALLARARTEELALLARLSPAEGLTSAAKLTWEWLSAPEHRPIIRLWAEAYARSLVDAKGPWAGFAESTVTDWLEVLAGAQPPAERDSPDGLLRRTAALALLRGAAMDLLATGDTARTTAAVHRHLP